MATMDEIMAAMESRKNDFGLKGVELTTEDAEYCTDIIKQGSDLDTAIGIVLSGIADCLSQGY